MKVLLFLFGTIIAGNLMINGCVRPSTTTVPSQSEAPIPEKAVFASLIWKPNMTKSDFKQEPLSIYNSLTFSVTTFTDTRQDTRIIGKTLEDKKIQGVFVPLITKAPVAKWCKTGIVQSLQELGNKVNDKSEKCRLEIELVDFSIDDNITQTGSASFRITVNTSNDLLIWEGKISGTSDLYYRPKSSDGISECLSNTVLVTMNNLLTDQSFRDAVIKAFELQ